METYCNEVRHLKDKFHGLELNHIARRYNEAADKLAKIMSSRTTVPPDVFSRDLHEPSIDLGATEGVNSLSLDPPPEAKAPSTGADIMQMEGSPPPADLEPNWRFRTSTVSFEGSSLRIRPRLDGLLAEPRPL
jgi:hypothetical protein